MIKLLACRFFVGVLLALAMAGPSFAQAPTGVQEKEARVYGQRIHYLESGPATGPVVILLHGLGVDSTQWRMLMPSLTGYRVIALDQLGFGKSDKPAIRYRVQTFVDVLEAFYRQAGIQRATIVGNSMGGWVAALFAVQFPAKVEKLVLVDAAGYSPQRIQARPPTREDLQKFNASTLAEVRQLLMQVLANKALVNDVTVAAAFTQRLAAGDGHVIEALIDSVLRNQDVLDGQLGALSMPALVVWGRQDAMLPLSVAEAFAKDVPGARLEVLDNCGHAPHVECPAPFVAKLLQFLKQ